MKKQRTYCVKFTVLKTGDERTARITTTDSFSAACLAYANFGRRKIEVTSVEVEKNAI